MTKVILINQEKIPHYRIPVYNYLSTYLRKEMYQLIVVSAGVSEENTYRIEFDHREKHLCFLTLARFILEIDPEVVIYWVRLRHLYLFPMLLFIKLLKKKAIYWGHGTDLYGSSALWLKRFANDIEYGISDAIILYGEHLRKNLSPRHYNKIFIANNTLNFDEDHRGLFDKSACLSKYNIRTTKNIICMGRLQRRKRLEGLFEAFRLLGRSDIGLIFVGPDSDGVLSSFNGDNIYKLGAIYGDEKLNLLSAADVFCLPGAVGLSIVDAFYCGLPLVTDDGDISPESMYLKDGINGYVVPKGDIRRLAMRLQMLLDDDVLRERFSRAAKKEISTNGHIETMCKGFRDALYFVCHVSFRGSGRRPVF